MGVNTAKTGNICTMTTPNNSPAPALSVAPHQTMATQVMNHVRDAIQAGEMSTEEWYSVYKIAEELGVSRSPVREGLLRLEEAGVIEFVRNRGFRVIQPEPADVAEIFALRLAIEPAAAARAARYIDGEGIGKLKEMLTAMEAAMHAGDEQTFFQWDQQLHDAIVLAGNARRARAILDTLRTHTRLLSDSTVREYRSLAQVYSEHLPIVDALEHGLADAAHKHMAAHITATGRLLLKQNIRRVHPELDDDSPELGSLVDTVWDIHVG